MRLFVRRRSPRSHPGSPLSWYQHALCFAVAVVPTIYLAFLGAQALVGQINGVLKQSAPLASAAASGALGREVRIGRLYVNDASAKPGLTLGYLWDQFTRRDTLGTLPIVAENVEVANGDRLSPGQTPLARARRVTLYVSVPALIAGVSSDALPRLAVERPDIILIRRANGLFNLQELVKPSKGPAKSPFRSRIEVSDGRVRFTDYASKLRAPQFNAVDGLTGFADLGARNIRFEVNARAEAGTVTAQRLTGPLLVSGSAGRGLPGSRSDAPTLASAEFLARVTVAGADLSYFLPYQFDFPAFRITAGRANADISLSGPRRPDGAVAIGADGKPAKRPAPIVSLNARFGGVGLVASAAPQAPVTNANGTLTFDDGILSLDATARALGDPLRASGTLWNVGDPNGPPPQAALTIDAPRLSVARVLGALPQKQKLPPALALPNAVSVRASVQGALNDPVIVAQVAAPSIGFRGVGEARNIAADVTYSRGVVAATKVSANLDGGGTLSGRAGLRFGVLAPPVKKDGVPLRVLPANEQSAAFAVQAHGVPLATLKLLNGKSALPSNLRLAGTGDVEAVGKSVGGALTLAANVRAANLRVGDARVTTAIARVLVDRNRILIPSARVESPEIGSLLVKGNTDAGGALALQWTASGLDLARIGRLVRQSSLSGSLTATGTVGGTLQDPRVTLRDVIGLNLRYRTFAADIVSGAAITATRSRIALLSPLVVRRFPAVISVSGDVRDFLASAPGRAPDPVLNLTASIRNLDYSEVVRQSGGAVALPTQGNGAPPAFAGSLRTLTANVAGRVSNPRITGTGAVGRVLVGPYPIDSGSFAFAVRGKEIALSDVRVTASVGTITGGATIASNGEVSGSFAGRNLDLETLSFLTDKSVALGGEVSLFGTFSGTRDRPIVDVRVTPSRVVVAGVPFEDVTLTGLRYIANRAQKVERVEAPLLSFRQGATLFALRNASFNVKTGRLGAQVSVTDGNLSALIDVLRRSGLASTPSGERIIASLNAFPYPLGGAFAVEKATLAARVANGKLTDIAASGALRASAVQVGAFRADAVTLAGSLTGDVIRVSNFDVQSPQTTVRGSGVADLNGAINFTLDANNIALDLIRAFVPAFPAVGTLDNVTIRATGPTRTPQIVATLQGRDIDIVGALSESARVAAAQAALDPQAARAENVVNPGGGAAPATPALQGVRLSLVRADAEIARDAEGNARIVISDITLTKGAGELRVSGELPFTYDGWRIPTDQPLSIRAEVPRQNLSVIAALTLPAALVAPGGAANAAAPQPGIAESIGGTLDGNVVLGGTLAAPRLSGGLTVTDASFRFPRGGAKLPDPINPLNDLDAAIRFDGPNVIVDTLVATLGEPNGRADANFGTLSAQGRVTLRSLEALLGSGKGGGAGAGARTARAPSDGSQFGNLDFTLKLAKLRPVENNLLGLGEAGRGELNGTIAIKGPLLAPTISTPTGEPIVISNSYASLPSKTAKVNGEKSPSPFDPRFDLAFSTDKKSSISKAGLFQFDVNGAGSIGGTLNRPTLTGSFDTLGGYFQYVFARFRVDKGGRVDLRFTAPDAANGGANNSVGVRSGIVASNIVARTTQYANPGAVPSASSRLRDGGGPIAASTPSAGQRQTRYRISVTIDGPLDIFEDTDTATLDRLRLSFESDPPLSESQILALIGTQQQIELLARGDLQSAARLGVTQYLTSGLAPSLFAGIEQGVANTLGLEDFGVEYAPDAPIVLRLSKRFGYPLDRFVVSYSKSFQTRTQPGVPPPYELGLNYDLYELKTLTRYQPRIQIGVQTDEQRDFFTYLRGVITF